MPTQVKLGNRSYNIYVSDSFQNLPKKLKIKSREGWIISHPWLLRKYGKNLSKQLIKAGWKINSISVPQSESSKSLKTIEKIIKHLSANATMRIPTIFALGGGVIGDIAGFAAAIYRRGVPYVGIPTTLLSQVDSSIGGKVGVDLPHAKNFIGSFYQPLLVWNNTSLLRSLPDRQKRSGLAEIIKYGMLADPALFSYLEKNIKACSSLQKEKARKLITSSCAIKARIVSRDERDIAGLRATLNFGHTLGHALESATNYSRWTHGEAISIGMCAATDLAVSMKYCSPHVLRRLTNLIKAYKLPTRAKNIPVNRVKQLLNYDKKFIHGRQRWVLPKRVGKMLVTEKISLDALNQMFERYIS